jgi:hypothetical protein
MAIILPGGFNITNNEPVDARLTVADASARLNFSSANVYEGLLVYQQDTNEIYVLIDASDPSQAGNWALAASVASGSALTGISAGDGLSGGGSTGNVVLNLDTGSAHFTDALQAINYAGIFKQTGSYYSTTNDLQVTGSLTMKYDGSTDPFKITSASLDTFSVTGEGVLQLISQSDTPSARAGGIYFGSDGNFYFGS